MARQANGELVILDGAMGTGTRRSSGRSGSGNIAIIRMIKSPDLIRTIYFDYNRAGAGVITANSYSCNGPSLGHGGLKGDLMPRATRMAVELVKDARDSSNADGILIAGSLGPLGFDYDPDDVPPFERCL